MKYSSANMRMWSRLGPSGSLGVAAMELGSQNADTVFLTADMTFSAGLEKFRNTFPERIFNVGIAEQNLIGVAAGLASEGFTPFVVTYAAFLTGRAFDQVKVNLGYMKLPVKMIGLNAGFTTGIMGATHMALEDVAVMRSIPNITIVSPADMTELVKSVIAAAEIDGPVYIRFTGDMNQSQVYKEDYDFQIGRAVTLSNNTYVGGGIALITTGVVTASVLEAAQRLEKNDVRSRVINMHTIKPLDTDVLESVLDSDLIVTVEEHSINGGLGGAVAEYLSEQKSAPRLCRIGVNDVYPHAGSYQFLMKENGLDSDGIYSTVLEKYREVVS